MEIIRKGTPGEGKRVRKRQRAGRDGEGTYFSGKRRGAKRVAARADNDLERGRERAADRTHRYRVRGLGLPGARRYEPADARSDRKTGKSRVCVHCSEWAASAIRTFRVYSDRQQDRVCI